MPESPEFYRRHLPHWHPSGAIFFVTFRLKNSLPAKTIASLRERASAMGQANGESFVNWDRLLDRVHSGPRWLARDDVATLVKDALLYRDEREYRLYAFCIMPNHVHAVFGPLDADSSQVGFSTIIQSLKRETAREANRILGKGGAFWQDETYDHVVRDNREFTRIIGYVLNNPVKAGFVSRWGDWPWTYCREGAL